MSLFGEFHVPADSFALADTLEAAPGIVIETERVVATDEILTPYFWVSGGERNRLRGGRRRRSLDPEPPPH